jgi:hypothetical protein
MKKGLQGLSHAPEVLFADATPLIGKRRFFCEFINVPVYSPHIDQDGNNNNMAVKNHHSI